MVKRLDRLKYWVCVGKGDCHRPCVAVVAKKPKKRECPYGDAYWEKAFRVVGMRNLLNLPEEVKEEQPMAGFDVSVGVLP